MQHDLRSGRSHLALGPSLDCAGLEEAEPFWWRVYATACRYSLGSRRATVVVLADGAPWIGRRARAFLALPGVEVVEILDYFPMTQRLWQVAHAVFGPGSAQAAAWVEPLKDLLYTQGAPPVLAALATLSPAEPAAAEEVRTATAFVTEHTARLNYPAFVARSVPIGSGAIESACKTVLEARATGAGMRWSTPGLQATLSLRCVQSSGHWTTFWQSQPARRRLPVCPVLVLAAWPRPPLLPCCLCLPPWLLAALAPPRLTGSGAVAARPHPLPPLAIPPPPIPGAPRPVGPAGPEPHSFFCRRVSHNYEVLPLAQLLGHAQPTQPGESHRGAGRKTCYGQRQQQGQGRLRRLRAHRRGSKMLFRMVTSMLHSTPTTAPVTSASAPTSSASEAPQEGVLGRGGELAGHADHVEGHGDVAVAWHVVQAPAHGVAGENAVITGHLIRDKDTGGRGDQTVPGLLGGELLKEGGGQERGAAEAGRLNAEDVLDLRAPVGHGALERYGRTVRSDDDLRARHQAAGVTPDQRVITYCQLGVRAAHAAFTLRLLGYPDVAVYDGSWAEWAADTTRPVES